jgi:hypothetical protein
MPVGPAMFDCEPFDFFIATKRMTSGKSNAPAKGFRYSASGTPPKTFDVLLYPYVARRSPSVSTQLLADDLESCRMTGMKVTAGRKSDYIFIAPAGPAQASFADGGIRIDAEILLVRTSSGKARLVAGSNVRKVVFNGEALVRKDEPVTDLYLDLKDHVH